MAVTSVNPDTCTGTALLSVTGLSVGDVDGVGRRVDDRVTA